MGDLLFALMPDFRGGILVVRARVIRIGELIEHLALPGSAHFLGDIARLEHALFFADQNDFGAIGAHGRKPFLAQIIRHNQDHAITAHGRDHRQRYAGIAAGGFDQHVPGGDFAARLGMRNHAECRPVLDRAGRVISLQFCGDTVSPAGTESLKCDERSISDIILQ